MKPLYFRTLAVVDAGDSNPLFRFAKSVYHTMRPKSGVAPMRRLLHRLKVKR